MVQTALRFGIQKAAGTAMSPKELAGTVGQHIERLLETGGDPQLAGQIRAAVNDPQAIIEIRSGKQVQTVTPGMPLRELLPPKTAEVEITVSRPHVGG
ncbi:hypothetical protein ACFL6X_06220 [Candidatus Latescibacterota bacterium]